MTNIRPNIHNLPELHNFEICSPKKVPELRRQNAVIIRQIHSPTELWEYMWTEANKLKIVKVGAKWCAPCMKVAPEYNVMAAWGPPGVDYFEVDVTDKTLKEKEDGPWTVFKAMGGTKLPYFALYKDHQRIDSVQTSNIEIVKELIKKHAAPDARDATAADVEPLLREDIDRFVLFPIKNKAIWDMYKKHESTFWTAEELDLEADKKDFREKLNDNERYFIKHVLAFFAASDAIVNENLVQNFMDEVQSAEARCFYGFQIMIENIHCCSGDTVVLTDKGHFPLDLLANKGEKVNAWNGYEWSEVLPQLVKEEDDMMLVQLSNGASLKCTPDHKWILQKSADRVETKNLKPGDKLVQWELPDEGLQEVVHIESVTALPDKEPTYCFNEPKNHTGMFNGIMTGQSETYSLLIDNLIGDKEEKKHLFNAIKTVPIIKKKAEWCFRWTDRSQASFAERLVAFACVEGIFFSGSFCAVFWLKKRGILPGVTFSNQLISRDEGLHCDFACLLYSQLERKLDQDRVHQIVDSAVQMECEFVSSALPVSLIGMNAKLMCQYIRFCADRLIEALGYEKKYNTTNPFEWMNIISLQNKSNFFFFFLAEYAKAGVGVEDDEGFTLDADF